MRNIFRRISEIIIPTVYDDALSYGQLLNKVVCSLNSVIKWVNELPHVHTINGAKGNVTLKKLRFTGYSNAEYNGADDVTVHIPVNPPEGGIAQLSFTGGASGVYDGNEALTVEIPEVTSVNGQTGDVLVTAESIGAVTPLTMPQSLPNPMPLIINEGGNEKVYDGTQAVSVCVDCGGSGSGAVQSVNGKTGNVILSASDVGALSVSSRAANPFALIMTGAVDAVYDGSRQITIDIPAGGGEGGGAVTSVNGQTGAVVLDANAVGALPNTVNTLPNPYGISFTGFIESYYDGRNERIVRIPSRPSANNPSTTTVPAGITSFSVPLHLPGIYIIVLEGQLAVDFQNLGVNVWANHSIMSINYDPVTMFRSFMFNVESSQLAVPLQFKFSQATGVESYMRIYRLTLTE